MTQLEAHLAAETVAAQLLDQNIDAGKLKTLRGILCDLTEWTEDEFTKRTALFVTPEQAARWYEQDL